MIINMSQEYCNIVNIMKIITIVINAQHKSNTLWRPYICEKILTFIFAKEIWWKNIIKKFLMMNCLCGMIDLQKAFSLISSHDHCQRSSPSRISNTSWAGFEPAQNLSSGFIEWICTVVITTTQQHKNLLQMHSRLVVSWIILKSKNIRWLQ